MTPYSDPAAILNDPRFAQVRARDRSADGQFVYAVRTTGVFCRPSCRARAARPENMSFYPGPAEAQAAGYRPCRRCTPHAPRAADDKVARMIAVAAMIDAHPEATLTLDRLGAMAQMSPFHLQRSFKAVMGVSPRDYQAARRREAFKAGLRAGHAVLDAVFDAGYGSTSRVYEQVERGLGMTPSAWRAGGAGQSIVYAIRETALGMLMMAATERGVCFVQFGDEAGDLLHALAAEFPHARREAASPAADAALNDWMDALHAHLDCGAPRPELPLEVRGTAFQIQVWRFLLGVKPGEVVSYTELAAGIGAPRAVRAAASACGANRLGVLIPCHRALRADGGLGGYRWGLDRKRALLAAERRLAEPPA